MDFCEELYISGVRSPFLVAFLIDMYEEKCLRSDYDSENIDELSTKVLEYCKLMATNFDKIREKYWDYVAANFKNQMAKNQRKANKNSVHTSEDEPLSTV